MAFNKAITPTYYSNLEFYTVIGQLKDQNALSEDFLLENNPFFAVPTIPKETEIRELFKKPQNEEPFKKLFQEIVLSSDEDCLRKLNVMTFAQICLYKVLPCPQAQCPHKPREIVTRNQYKDNEYECPFYHHERDRRIVLSLVSTDSEDELRYKASYFEEGRSETNKEKYSQNYFESMFHPVYYKMFRCKAQHQHSDQFCPFYHTEQERDAWDRRFNNFMKKERVSFVKDKQKYYENTGSPIGCKQRHSYENQSPILFDRSKNSLKNTRKENISSQYQKSYSSRSQEWMETSSNSSGEGSSDCSNLSMYFSKVLNYPKQLPILKVY